MRKERLLLHVYQHFSLVEIYISKQGVQGESALKETSSKSTVRNKRYSSSTNDIKIKYRDDQEITFPAKKRARTERSTMISIIKSRKVKKSSEGSRIQQHTKTNTEKLHLTADVMKNMTAKAKELCRRRHVAWKLNPCYQYFPALTTD